MRESAFTGLVLQETWESGGPADGYPNTSGAGSYPGAPARVEVMPERGLRLRVLVAFEDGYRSYRQTIARVLETLRPHAEVTLAGLEALEDEIKLTAPHLVICSQPGAGAAAHTMAWVELPNDPWRPASICIEGSCSRVSNAALDDLLAAVDRAEELVRSGKDRRSGCAGRR